MNIHRIFDKGSTPKLSDESTDMTYLSKDCFHFSQKGHALAANALWNSMLTPENERLQYVKHEFEEFKCPSTQKPFLATTKNS